MNSARICWSRRSSDTSSRTSQTPLTGRAAGADTRSRAVGVGDGHLAGRGQPASIARRARSPRPGGRRTPRGPAGRASCPGARRRKTWAAVFAASTSSSSVRRTMPTPTRSTRWSRSRASWSARRSEGGDPVEEGADRAARCRHRRSPGESPKPAEVTPPRTAITIARSASRTAIPVASGSTPRREHRIPLPGPARRGQSRAGSCPGGARGGRRVRSPGIANGRAGRWPWPPPCAWVLGPWPFARAGAAAGRSEPASRARRAAEVGRHCRSRRRGVAGRRRGEPVHPVACRCIGRSPPSGRSPYDGRAGLIGRDGAMGRSWAIGRS